MPEQERRHGNQLGKVGSAHERDRELAVAQRAGREYDADRIELTAHRPPHHRSHRIPPIAGEASRRRYARLSGSCPKREPLRGPMPSTTAGLCFPVVATLRGKPRGVGPPQAISRPPSRSQRDTRPDRGRIDALERDLGRHAVPANRRGCRPIQGMPAADEPRPRWGPRSPEVEAARRRVDRLTTASVSWNSSMSATGLCLPPAAWLRRTGSRSTGRRSPGCAACCAPPSTDGSAARIERARRRLRRQQRSAAVTVVGDAVSPKGLRPRGHHVN